MSARNLTHREVVPSAESAHNEEEFSGSPMEYLMLLQCRQEIV